MPRRSASSRSAPLAVAPVEVGAGHDHRPLGAVAAAPARRSTPSATRLVQRAGSVGPSAARLGLHEDEVQREVHEHRPGVRAQRDRERLVDEPGISAVAPAVAASLVTGAHERHVVDLLQRALPPAHRGRAPAEHDHRRVVLHRAGHRAHAVGDARAGGQRGDAGLAGDLRPALGGERRGLPRGACRRCRCPRPGSRHRARRGARPRA